MEDNIIIEDIEFKEELYRKNIEKEEIKYVIAQVNTVSIEDVLQRKKELEEAQSKIKKEIAKINKDKKNNEKDEDVEKDDKGVYVVSGPRIDRMLGYTNLESEKGFNFFDRLTFHGETPPHSNIESGEPLSILITDY